MSPFSSSCQPTQVPSSPRENRFHFAGHDQAHMLGTDVGLMEMSEFEYTHLQHLIQAHMDAQAPDEPDARTFPATDATVISPFMTTQAIDLSTSTEEHCLVIPEEKTPLSYGDVPGFVLARIKGEDHPSSNSSPLAEKRTRSAARVCLEKRFNTMPANTQRPQEAHSAVLNK